MSAIGLGGVLRLLQCSHATRGEDHGDGGTRWRSAKPRGARHRDVEDQRRQLQQDQDRSGQQRPQRHSATGNTQLPLFFHWLFITPSE